MILCLPPTCHGRCRDAAVQRAPRTSGGEEATELALEQGRKMRRAGRAGCTQVSRNGDEDDDEHSGGTASVSTALLQQEASPCCHGLSMLPLHSSISVLCVADIGPGLATSGAKLIADPG